MGVVVIALHRRLFQCSVHSLHLPVGPGVGNFCQAVLNSIFPTNPVKDVLKCRCILLAIGELHAIVCKDRMDARSVLGGLEIDYCYKSMC